MVKNHMFWYIAIKRRKFIAFAQQTYFYRLRDSKQHGLFSDYLSKSYLNEIVPCMIITETSQVTVAYFIEILTIEFQKFEAIPGVNLSINVKFSEMRYYLFIPQLSIPNILEFHRH